MHPILQDILKKRNIIDIENFINPKIKNLMPNPYDIPQMSEAVKRFMKAFQAKEKIGLFGDYDVDGGTSVALFIKFFKDINFEVYIPHRLKEGYGPNNQAMDYFKSKDVSLVVFMDCGTQAVNVLSYAKTLGLDLIVLDHHIAREPLFADAFIVNPNAHTHITNPCLKNLCAAGVTFLFLSCLLKYFPEYKNRLLDNLDLVALGTVCDIMPLLNFNRALVKQGLKVVNLKNNIGITALSSIAGLEEDLTAQHFGFYIGPRINAGGRIGHSEFGYQILSTSSQDEAIRLSMILNKLNTERKDLQSTILDEAVTEIEKNNLNQHNILLLGKHHWHPGVIGIVAGRLKDLYHKPALVVGFNDEALGIGSGRAPEGSTVTHFLEEALKQQIILGGGGHECAFGFKLHYEQIEGFYEFLIAKTTHFQTIKKTYEADVILNSFEDITLDLLRTLSLLEPYGHKNPEPLFMIQNVFVESFQMLKDKHFKGVFKDSSDGILTGLCFDVKAQKLDEKLCVKNKPMNIIIRLSKNVWRQEESVGMMIVDVIN